MAEMNKRASAIYDVLSCSSYRVFAIGNRNLENNEMVKFCNILSGNCEEMFSNAINLYKYAPATTELNKSLQKSNCSYFNESKCKCYLPDHRNECWYRELLDKDNQRDRKRHEYQEWRTKVFQRDNYTCQDCDQKGGLLNAHHIKSYAKYKKLRYELSNGVTLCKKCHDKRHKKRV